MNRTAQEAIVEYMNHSCEATYIRAALKEHGVQVIADTLATMFRSGNRQQAHAADFFMRDTMSYLPISERPPFVKAFSKSEAPSALRELIFCKNHFLREMAVQTVGRFSLEPDAALLQKALNQFRSSDPLLVPLLVQQIQGLTSWKDPSIYRKLLDDLSSSKSYLSRWPVLEGIEPFAFIYRVTKDKGAREFESKLVSKLSTDENRFVRSQAQWLKEKFDILPKMRSGDLKERKAISKDIAAREPRLNFQAISIRFGNELNANGKDEYTVEELDSFVKSFEPFIDGDRLHLRDVMHIYLRENRQRDETVAKEWLSSYLKDDQRLERFKREFKRVWQDKSSSSREKAELYSGASYASDAAATDFLKKIWLDAVGKEWKP